MITQPEKSEIINFSALVRLHTAKSINSHGKTNFYSVPCGRAYFSY